MISTLFRRLRALWRLSATYEQDKLNAAQALQNMAKLVHGRTTLHADIGMGKGPDIPFIILVGQYAGHDYVQVVRLPRGDFQALIKHCREMRREGRWVTVDAPPVMSACFFRDMDYPFGDPDKPMPRRFHPDHDDHPDSHCNCPSCR